MCDQPHLKALKRYGSHPLASLCLEPGYRYFNHKSGFIPYIDRKRVTVVLGDPISNPDHRKELLHSFLKRYPRSIFVQISTHTATQLKNLGYHILPFGSDHQINCSNYSINWREHKSLKRSIKSAQSKQYQVQEIESVTPEITQELSALATQWRLSRKSKRSSQGLLVSPYDYSLKADHRLFCLFDSEQKIKAAIHCSPFYSRNKVIGYTTLHSLFDPQIKENLNFNLIYHVIQTLKNETIPTLSLGSTPFINAPNQFSLTFLQRLITTKIYPLSRFFYNFQGPQLFKSRFKAKEIPSYLATKNRLPLLDVLTVYDYCMNGISKDINSK